MAKKGKRTRLGELPRSGPEVAQASMLISALMMTPDDGYEKFRARRAGNRTLDPAHLGRARDMLDAIAEAVGASDGKPERWQRLELAWRALFETEPVAAGRAVRSESATAAQALGEAPTAAERATPAATAVPVPPVVLDVRVSEPEPAPAPPEPARAAPMPPAPMPPAPVPPALVSPAATPPPAAYAGLPAHAQAALAALERAELTAKAAPHNQTLPLEGTSPPSAPLPFVEGVFAPAPTNVDRPAALRATLEAGGVNPARHEQPASHKPLTLPFARPPSAPPPAPVEEADLALLPPHLARLSVEQFAVYCAHCAAHPNDPGVIAQRYGFSGPEQRAALERCWHARLQKDPALLAAWREHLKRAQGLVGRR